MTHFDAVVRIVMATITSITKVWLAFSSVLLLCCPWLPSARAAQPPKGRYLQIVLPGAQRILSLAEVQVYAGDANIAFNGKAIEGSIFNNANATRAIDGNTSGNYSDLSIASTESEMNPWWELDLGAEYAITKIVIYNTTDCCRDRINPASVLLLNDAKQSVWEGTIASESSRYEWDTTIPPAVAQSISRNLLRNSTFQQRTNHPIPDYWDLHHAAARKFKNLHDQYGIDENIASPVIDANVLKLINEDDAFDHLILIPHRLFSKLPEGDYTFSVYIKSDRTGAEYRFTPAWGQGKIVRSKLSTQWERYVTTFHFSGSNPDTIQPILNFPSKGIYYVAAPQLEKGTTPSFYQPSHDDIRANDVTVPSRSHTLNLLNFRTNEVTYPNTPPFSAAFEYNYYTKAAFAHLRLSSQYDLDLEPKVQCRSHKTKPFPIPIEGKAMVRQRSSLTLDVPINDLPTGDYTCTVEAFKGRIRHAVVSATLRKLPTNLILEVRINAHKRFITVNDKPFHIIGIEVGGGGTLPDWYFQDVAAHGINTLFYTNPPNSLGEYDIRDLERFISAAARHGLKVIIGSHLAGAKVSDWRQRINSFCVLIANLKDNPTVIGWNPVDEPASNTWRDDELIEIHDKIKTEDPYRLIFINWAYDGVPPEVGQEPRGTLASTDIYSIDYYPFAGQGRSLHGFTEITARAVISARIHNKIPHSWIQIYGGMDAWREPTGDELNYMVYLNLIFGGTVSYWDTKSNSRVTWDRLAAINQEVKILSEELFLNPEAFEIAPPAAKDNFIYSAWQKGKRTFLIVLHNGNKAELFVSALANSPKNGSLRVRSLFQKGVIPIINGEIHDMLSPFESKVYILHRE